MINTILQAPEQFKNQRVFVGSPANVPITVYENEDLFATNTLLMESDSTSTSEESTDDQQAPDSTDPDFEQLSYAKLKLSLKEKIRFRRESEGAEEITNLFQTPKKYKLTAEEEVKNAIRKQRNRISANKSRLKRIAREKILEKEAKDLEDDHTKLVKEVEYLKKYKDRLLQNFKDHDCKTLNQTNTGDGLGKDGRVTTISAMKRRENWPHDTPDKYIKLDSVPNSIGALHNDKMPRVKSEPIDTEFDRVFSEVKVRNHFLSLTKDNQACVTTMNLPITSNCKLNYASLPSTVNTSDLFHKTSVANQINPNDSWTSTFSAHIPVNVDAMPVFIPQSTHLQGSNNQPCERMTECHDKDLQIVLNDLGLLKSEGVLNVGQPPICQPLPVMNAIQPTDNITDCKPHKPSIAGINLSPYTVNEEIDKIKSYLLDKL